MVTLPEPWGPSETGIDTWGSREGFLEEGSPGGIMRQGKWQGLGRAG